MAVLSLNKQASFDYEILERFEAGLILLGHEVKSIRNGNISLKESFVTLHKNELYLTNAHIGLYAQAGQIKGYDPTRPRKLLLKKAEIRSLIGKMKTQGLTLVPIRVYTKKRLLKLEFGLGKGKKKFDKRQSIQKRESERKIDRALKIRG